MCGSHCSDICGIFPVDSHRRAVPHTLLAIAIAKAKALNNHREFRGFLVTNHVLFVTVCQLKKGLHEDQQGHSLASDPGHEKEYFPIYAYFPLSDIIKEKRQVTQKHWQQAGSPSAFLTYSMST